MSNHLVDQITHHPLKSDNILHVVVVISNPERYNSRYRLAREAIDRLSKTPNVQLHIVETAFGDRQHEIEPPPGANILRLRTKTNAWIKENMINLGVRYLLPQNWRYLAWVDADVEFRNPHWAQETLHQLQHHAIIQPWAHVTDLLHHGSIHSTTASFGYTDAHGTRQRHTPNGYTYGHTGYAWACTRPFWEQVEGLIDFCILGSADHHMALACVGEAQKTIHTKMIPAFFRRIYEWQERAVRVSHREVGFTEGRIEHNFHGQKKKRYYKERWQILVDAGFDPDRDLMRDDQGLIHIVGKPELEAAIRKYNRSRMEDSIDD